MFLGAWTTITVGILVDLKFLPGYGEQVILSTLRTIIFIIIHSLKPSSFDRFWPYNVQSKRLKAVWKRQNWDGPIQTLNGFSNGRF